MNVASYWQNEPVFRVDRSLVGFGATVTPIVLAAAIAYNNNGMDDIQLKNNLLSRKFRRYETQTKFLLVLVVAVAIFFVLLQSATSFTVGILLGLGVQALACLRKIQDFWCSATLILAWNLPTLQYFVLTSPLLVLAQQSPPSQLHRQLFCATYHWKLSWKRADKTASKRFRNDSLAFIETHSICFRFGTNVRSRRRSFCLFCSRVIYSLLACQCMSFVLLWCNPDTHTLH